MSFFGAAREVTGSCYLVESSRARILIDCGMFQGGHISSSRNFDTFPFDPSTIDAVVITHAHLDHTGRLPLLLKRGFRGKIFATAPTTDLMQLVLEDAYQIMRDDHKREYRPMLYEKEDIKKTFQRCIGMDYSSSKKLGDLSFRFRDAGHIFGSAFVECFEYGGARIAFSGDIGNVHVPILRPTAQLARIDELVIESTYGNRLHEDESTREQKLAEAVKTVIRQNGTLLIPAFAIERTQQLLFELHKLHEKKKIPLMDVYLDSSLAIHATEVLQAYPQYYDPEALTHITRGENLFSFPRLKLCPTREDSKLINDAQNPKIVIAGSGMMNGGRILHHLLRVLPDPRSIALIIGYQAEKTLGCKLYHGEKNVEIFGERVHVKARVTSIGAYSAHADQEQLMQWVKEAEQRPMRIYCTHGDESACVALATQFRSALGIPATAPRFGENVEI